MAGPLFDPLALGVNDIDFVTEALYAPAAAIKVGDPLTELVTDRVSLSNPLIEHVAVRVGVLVQEAVRDSE